MHAVAAERIGIGRQRSNQRLALTGAHLGNLALVQSQTAEQLLVVMPQAKGAPRTFAHGGEGFGQQRIEFDAVFQPRTKLVGLGAEFGIAERLELVGKSVGGGHDFAVAAQHPLVAAAENFGKETGHSCSSLTRQNAASTAAGPNRLVIKRCARLLRCKPRSHP